MQSDEARERLAHAQVARLATVSAEGQPHLVPVTFVLRDNVIVIAIDHKPKSTRNLKRLRNIEATGTASVLADHYDDDWTQLWWVRADGPARITGEPEPLLAAKYHQYKDNPPAGPFIRIKVSRLSWWSAV